MQRKFDVQIDEATHLAFTRLACGRQYMRTAINGTGILALLLIVGLVTDGVESPLVAGAIAGWIALCLLLAIQWLLLPRRARKIFRKSSLLDEVQHFLVDDEELTIETELSRTRVPLGRLVKWDENSEVLALYPQPNIAYLVPKSQVPPETCDYVRQRVIAAGLPMKNKERK